MPVTAESFVAELPGLARFFDEFESPTAYSGGHPASRAADAAAESQATFARRPGARHCGLLSSAPRGQARANCSARSSVAMRVGRGTPGRSLARRSITCTTAGALWRRRSRVRSSFTKTKHGRTSCSSMRQTLTVWNLKTGERPNGCIWRPIVFVFVTDALKYADASTWEYLGQIKSAEKQFCVALNKTSSTAVRANFHERFPIQLPRFVGSDRCGHPGIAPRRRNP